MDNKSLLDICLHISGSFENNEPSYTAVTGNFDKQGLSVGVLQWCAGQGSLGPLLTKIQSLGVDLDQNFTTPVSPIIQMSGAEAVGYVKAHFLDGIKVTPQALSQWTSLLGSEEGIQAQVELACSTILSKASSLAQTFCPSYPDNTRVIAFFFDVVTQSGGMSNSRGRVRVVSEEEADPQAALQFAQNKAKFYATIQGNLDPLANYLLYYAYERAKLSKPEYIWDAFSRRATIACRSGIVHGLKFDLLETLP